MPWEHAGCNAWSRRTCNRHPNFLILWSCGRMTLEVKCDTCTSCSARSACCPSPARIARGKDPVYEAVDSLQLDGKQYQGWQEAVEREVTIGPLRPAGIRATQLTSFTFPASHPLEPLRGPDGRIAAVIVRDQQAMAGSAEISTERLEEAVFRLTVRVFNRTIAGGRRRVAAATRP